MSYQSFNDWVMAFKEVPPHLPGLSPLEKLPNEVLSHILQYVNSANTRRRSRFMKDNLLEVTSTAPAKNTNLLHCALISRRMRDVALPALYHSPSLEEPSIYDPQEDDSNVKAPARLLRFGLFMRTISEKPEYGKFVRALDLMDIDQPLDNGNISACLALCPLLRQLSIPTELLGDPRLFMRIFFESEHLKYLDSRSVPNHENAPFLFQLPPPEELHNLNADITSSIASLSFGYLECGAALRLILPRCPSLVSLKLSSCEFEQGTLSSLSVNAKLETLELDNCSQVTADDITHILDNNGTRLEVLNLGQRQFLDGEDSRSKTRVEAILDNIPTSLRSLQVGGLSLRSNCSILQSLSAHLEELGIGDRYSSRLDDLEEVLLGHRYDLSKVAPVTRQSIQDLLRNYSISTDAVATARLQLRLNSILPKTRNDPASPRSRIQHLSLRYMDVSRKELEQSILLGPQSLPLRSIELHRNNWMELKNMAQFLASMGWRSKVNGHRCWIERM